MIIHFQAETVKSYYFALGKWENFVLYHLNQAKRDVCRPFINAKDIIPYLNSVSN